MTSTRATERDRICECQVFSHDCEDKITVETMVDCERHWATIDTAASSIWDDAHWFLACSGRFANKGHTAAATDVHEINVVGTGHLSFILWGC